MQYTVCIHLWRRKFCVQDLCICLFVSMYVCMYVSLCIYVSVCMYLYVCIYVCICMNICTVWMCANHYRWMAGSSTTGTSLSSSSARTGSARIGGRRCGRSATRRSIGCRCLPLSTTKYSGAIYMAGPFVIAKIYFCTLYVVHVVVDMYCMHAWR